MGLFLHLSQLLGLVVPFGGIAVPIVLWQINKDKMPALDAHGKMIVNWMLSSLVYGLIGFVLLAVFIFLMGLFSFFFVVVLGFVALGIMSIVFPIIGAIKANNGELWEYPLTIKFLK